MQKGETSGAGEEGIVPGERGPGTIVSSKAEWLVSRSVLRAVMLMLMLLAIPGLLAGCGDGEDAGEKGSAEPAGKQTSSKKKENEEGLILSGPPKKKIDPLDLSIKLLPTGVVTQYDTLKLEPKGFALGEAEYLWFVEGELVENASPYQMEAGRLELGDSVFVKGVYKGNVVLSNVVEVKNTPPRIESLKLTPVRTKDGGIVFGVEPEAVDPDGDPVLFEYEWRIDGDIVSRGERLDRPLGRGESFELRVQPYDGEDYGDVYRASRTVENSAPNIVYTGGPPKYELENGMLSHQVEARDPDGDKLSYHLLEGPEGAAVDENTGMLTWRVPNDFVGTVSFKVAARDPAGGEATQILRFTITEEPVE